MLRPTNLSVSLLLAFVSVTHPACVEGALEESLDPGNSSTGTAWDEPDSTTDAPATSDPTGSTTTTSTGSTGAESTTGTEAPDTSSTGEDTTGAASTGDTSSGGEETTGSDAPAACDELPGVLLCEDFEEPVIDAQRWNKLQGAGGSVQLGDERVLSGAQALHLHIAAEQGSEANLELLATTDVFPVDGNHFFGRVFAYVTPDLPNKHSLWITAAGELDGKTAKYRLDSAGGGKRFKATYGHPSIEQHGGLQKVGRTVPIGAWVCIEWEFDGPNDAARFWFDGELDAALTVTGAEDPPWAAPVFKTFILGHKTLQQPDSAPAYDIWMDALVLATERIGCG